MLDTTEGIGPVQGLRRHAWMPLTRKVVNGTVSLMFDIQVIDDPAAATVALEPMRSRLLSELTAPASAATLASRVGLARQKVNYHLHALEAHGLVRLAEERKWGGLTERLLVATAASYVVSPSAMGPVAVDPKREVDRLSASYLIALGARVVREVGDLVRRAKAANKRSSCAWMRNFCTSSMVHGANRPVLLTLGARTFFNSRPKSCNADIKTL